MVKSLLSSIALFVLLPGLILAQTGSIQGTVKTSDGQPAEFVNIVIKGTGKGVTANKNGSYQLKNISPGSYTIIASFIGLEKQEQATQVTAGGITTLDFVLKESAQVLQEVVVSANANRYQESIPSQSLRLNAPILEIPQNIQLVTRSVLNDQQVISMSDGLVRNVSGAVRMEHWGDLYTNISSRGSQIQAFRNGFNVVNSYWGPLTEDMSFVDHIEFVKGPAGFMLANGDPSGLYNVVTKKPTGQTKGEASLTLGSFDLYRSALDLDGKLTQDGKLLYRLNLSAQNKKSHRPYEYNNRYVVAPVLSYQITDKTKLTFEYTYQHANMSNVGSYYVFAADGFGTLPHNFTTLSPGLPATNIHDHSFFANVEHYLSNTWKVTAQLARFNYTQQGSSMWPTVVNPDGTMIRGVNSWDAKSNMTMGQVFLNGEVTTGPVRHRILTGLDMANKEYFADWGQSHALDTVGAEFNIYAPTYGTPVNGFPRFDHSSPIEERATVAGGTMDQRYSALYLQDELGFLDNKVRLTLAGRYTNVRQSEYGGPLKSAERFTPRVGLSVSLNKQTSAYALYDQAFIPQNGRLSSGGTVKPITGNNLEVGIKRDWAEGKWNSTIAIYRILKNNELTADPNSPPASGLSMVLGEKRAQGVEFDLRGRLTKELSLIANYAYTDSRVTKVAEGITAMKEGDIVPGYAKHTTNAWLNYRVSKGVLKGAGVSAGFTYLAGRETYWEVSPDPTQVLPDYFKLDGGLFWENDHIRITANVFNILDKYLYSGSYYSWLAAYNWQTEPGRNFRMTVAYKF
ncbi:TonB-dependent receptor [Rhodocytophaga rosea]|uniref:TonB-dependent receptor n=1 Tax=Rhodocytophaga rosea TaxID=2704465 RepID=A0A6C0GUP8_9BACT|nr:TonB-dependent siderophore receptor [Rhodocytophaga rosea]QHT71534.1 TonB-dependent receptor [Rhodocytophaga rosea]